MKYSPPTNYGCQMDGVGRRSVPKNPKRNGFSFAELIISIALITFLFGLVAQINITISNAVLRNELHLAASEELDNILEQVAAIPYDQITTETASELNLIRTKNRLASWTMSLRTSETTSNVPTKRIEVVLASPVSQGIQVRRVYWKTLGIRTSQSEESP